MNRLLIAALSAAVLVGCGSQEPAHEVKPLTSRPTPTSDFASLKSPEEKIKYIQNSPAPEDEKQRAIARVRAGQL